MKSKIIRALLGALTAAICLSGSAKASNTAGYGYIYGLYGTSNGAVLFSVKLDGSTRSGIPSCGSANTDRWALDASTVPGQAAVQVLMTAYQQHRPVFVNGTGTCTIWGDTETVNFFNLADM